MESGERAGGATNLTSRSLRELEFRYLPVEAVEAVVRRALKESMNR